MSPINTSLGQKGAEQLAPVYLLYKLHGQTFMGLVSEVAEGGILVLAGWPCFDSRTESQRPWCPSEKFCFIRCIMNIKVNTPEYDNKLKYMLNIHNYCT